MNITQCSYSTRAGEMVICACALNVCPQLGLQPFVHHCEPVIVAAAAAVVGRKTMLHLKAISQDGGWG